MGFVDSFPGQKLVQTAGPLTVGDVSVTGIAAAHQEIPVDPAATTDVVYVVEIAGVRVAFFGEIGQTELSADQLSALGQVDVLVGPLSNANSVMNATNKKGFNLARQVRARVLIPMYTDMDTTKLAVAEWKGFYSTAPSLTLSKATLPSQPSVLFMGGQAANYGSLLHLPECNW